MLARSRIGVITVDDFFDKVVFEKRGMVGDAVFQLIDTEDDQKVEFGEFVQAVTTFCMFEPREILHFIFYIFDREKNGYIASEELHTYVAQLHGQDLQSNLETAINALDFNSDGKFEFDEFKDMHKQYPQVLYPVFRLQTKMMNSVGGAAWWNSKKRALAYQKEMKAQKEMAERRKQARMIEQARQRQIRRHMGALKYYAMPHKRSKYDEMYPPAKRIDVQPAARGR